MRAAKPREVGITHVMDKGLTLSQIEGLLATARRLRRHRQARLGHVVRDAEPAARSSTLYRSLGIPVVCGGTLLEIAEVRGKLDGYRSWLSEQRLRRASRSPTARSSMPRERKLEIIELLAQDFRVLSEVGSKDAEAIFAPYQWVALDPRGARRRRLEGHHRGARVRHGRHLPRQRRGAQRA